MIELVKFPGFPHPMFPHDLPAPKPKIQEHTTLFEENKTLKNIFSKLFIPFTSLGIYWYFLYPALRAVQCPPNK